MKPHILVIEDNHHVAESLIDILDDDYQVTVAFTGSEGLTEALTSHPELIILDIRLPDIDGYKIYHTLRGDAWGKDAKVLVLTASESIDNVSKNIDLPKEFILLKSKISVVTLREKISERLAQ